VAQEAAEPGSRPKWGRRVHEEAAVRKNKAAASPLNKSASNDLVGYKPVNAAPRGYTFNG
jgi:hypothetical protein